MKIKTLLLLVAFGSVLPVLKAEPGDGPGTGGMQMYSQKTFTPVVTTVITPKDKIELTFDANIGVAYVTIKNQAGVAVSRSRVDTSLNTTLQIGIANFPSGTYTLLVTDSKGAVIESNTFVVD